MKPAPMLRVRLARVSYARMMAPFAAGDLLMPTVRLPGQTRDSSAFLLGADISALTMLENAGAVFRDGGRSDDAIAILTRHGWNCLRLRLFVNPDGRGGVVNDLAYTRSLARRIKAAGAAFLLDLHYSDTWADPQHQIKPAAWQHLDFDGLELQIENYTAAVISDLSRNGTPPDMVQIGNEITGGMLWPDAQVRVPPSDVKRFEGLPSPPDPPQPYDDARQWDRLARLVKAAIRGVRAASALTDGVRVLLHIDCGGDWPLTKWFFDHMIDRNVQFDMIAQSYYPHWHGTLDQVRQNLRNTAERYHKGIIIAETAYPWKNAQFWAARSNMNWPVSPSGQRRFLMDLVRTVRDTPNGLGRGVVYWHPESVQIEGSDLSAWNGGAMALFDDQGNALPAIDLRQLTLAKVALPATK